MAGRALKVGDLLRFIEEHQVPASADLTLTVNGMDGKPIRFLGLAEGRYTDGSGRGRDAKALIMAEDDPYNTTASKKVN